MNNTVNVLLIYSAKRDLERLVIGFMPVKEYISVLYVCLTVVH